ncbi:MAG TPA: CsgG/HfaB family protein [Gemmatimonadaceae bacterium]|jgi:curli biogenesis system outer membrane secretion channel CsgG
MTALSAFRLARLALACLVVAGTASAQDALRTGPRLRIGVMDLTGTALAIQQTSSPGSSSTTIPIPPPSDFARGLTQMLTTALAARPEFTVVERSQLDKVAAEQQLGASGRVEAKSAASLGKLLGAQALITGDITEFTYKQSSAGSKLSILKAVDSKLGGKLDRLTAQVAIDLRIIDATTGAVVSSVRGEGSSTATGVSADYSKSGREVGIGGSKQTPLGAASRQAIDKGVEDLVKKLRNMPWQGRVADVRGDMIYINAGTDIGIKTGMQFDVFVQGDAIVDPETGATLGSPDKQFGQLTITEVSPKFAVGRMTAGSPPKRNDVVRFRGGNGS